MKVTLLTEYRYEWNTEFFMFRIGSTLARQWTGEAPWVISKVSFNGDFSHPVFSPIAKCFQCFINSAIFEILSQFYFLKSVGFICVVFESLCQTIDCVDRFDKMIKQYWFGDFSFYLNSFCCWFSVEIHKMQTLKIRVFILLTTLWYLCYWWDN